MARRREFRSVALGVLGAFVSRNNDLEGYWGIGKLYQHAHASGTRELEIDLLGSTMIPPSPSLDELVPGYSALLKAQLRARRIPESWLGKATLSVVFNSSATDPPRFETAPDGDVFECVIELQDDRGASYRERTTGRCRRHDALRESKSARSG